MASISYSVLPTYDQTIYTVVPPRSLLAHSLQLHHLYHKNITDWSPKEHDASFRLMRHIATKWENVLQTDQYLVYANLDFKSNSLFHWEIVPYKTCKTIVGRILQQLTVLFRTIFGGVKNENIIPQSEAYTRALNPYNGELPITPTTVIGNDPFCKDEVIERQWVLKDRNISVLFNHAPIGFGGEKLDFLVVTNQHREKFTDLTSEEYCDAMAATAKVVNHFANTRGIHNVHLMHKTGVDAGQTVKHWHMRVIISTNSTQSFWGKCTVFKNILFGSSPMNKIAFEEKVAGFRAELA